MKNLLLLLSVCHFQSLAQPAKDSFIFSCQVNSVGAPSIEIKIQPRDLPGSIVAIDNDELSVELVTISGNKLTPNAEKQVTRSKSGIKIIITSINAEELENFNRLAGEAYILFNNDVTLVVDDDSRITYGKEEIATESLGKLKFDAEMLNEFVASSGGEFAFWENKFEVGLVPKQYADSEEMELILDFAYRKTYTKFPSVAFATKGYISSNKNDSLNFIAVYPVTFNVVNLNNEATELIIKTGIEGNQSFNYWRGSANLEFNKMLPNFLDLTYGFSRLRLRPILNAGFKFYSEFDNQRLAENADNQTSGQVFGGIYYVIPLYSNFTLIADTKAFFDFSEQVNPDKEIGLYYKLTFGYEVPNSGFQAVITYQNGENNINYQSDALISIGLLANILKKGQG